MRRLAWLIFSPDIAFSPHALLSTVFAMSILLSAAPARAGVGFQPVSQEELKITNEPLAPGAQAIVLYFQLDRDDNQSTPHEDRYVRIKILTEEGRKYGNIEIPFVRHSDDVTRLHARTIRPDGSVVEFDGKVEEKVLWQNHGTRYLAKTLALSDVQVGSIIEYYFTYDFKEHLLLNSRWIIGQDLFTRKADFSLKPYFNPYTRIHTRWSWQGLPPGVDPKQGSDHVIRMEVTNIPAFQKEDFMPPVNELKARVDFIYEVGQSELNVDKFWKEVGRTRNDQMEKFVGKHKAMEDAVAQIVAPNDPPEVKLRKIYDRVQQIRDTSFEQRKTVDERKRENEKIDENVEDVWKRGYGNRMQLNWLYLALVRAAGFDAYGCWVSERRNYFFTPTTLHSGMLDTNVVLVKLNGKDVYFDPGTEYAPFGMLTWYKTAVQGLCPNNKDGGDWIKTTLPGSSESRIEHKATLKLNENGELEGKVTVSYSGLEAAYHRQDVRNEDDVARKKFLETRLKNLIPGEAEAELTSQPDWKNSETPLVAEFNVKIHNWASITGKRAFMPAALFSAGEKCTFEQENRVHPIYHEYPYEKWDDVTIEIPSGWKVSSVPAPKSEDHKIVAYEMKVENTSNTLHLSRKFDVGFLLLDQKYYPALRNFYQVVRTADEEQIALTPEAQTGSN